MSQSKSLIITPFDAPGHRVNDTIKHALKEVGIQVIRIDELQTEGILAKAITEAINSSDFIIVDISRQNPNVMYELGYAHGIKKPTILVKSNESQNLPTDLMGYLYIVYDLENLRGLQEQISRAVRRFVSKKQDS